MYIVLYLYLDIRLREYIGICFDNIQVHLECVRTTIQLFERIPDALEYYQNKFQYIHVDEYQDTNKATIN
jgi:hypothetical protein